MAAVFTTSKAQVHDRAPHVLQRERDVDPALVRLALARPC